MEIQVDMVQDSIGQLCPMPIAFMAKNMKKLEAGQVLEIRSDDEGVVDELQAWREQTGNEFLGQEPAGDYFRYYVRKKVG